MENRARTEWRHSYLNNLGIEPKPAKIRLEFPDPSYHIYIGETVNLRKRLNKIFKDLMSRRINSDEKWIKEIRFKYGVYNPEDIKKIKIEIRYKWSCS